MEESWVTFLLYCVPIIVMLLIIIGYFLTTYSYNS